ncbi:MAG: carboxypeptidase regulatory-like domain-containing protein [Acidobacteria bacterium]|nr:carboxypeptidase regulatory-like domain-containing protein [Acidobacteriota bacterium]MCA1643172.1 carboxypeptidase regulatory-like domain-containing protein [Acidobacteriota bacterium]
MLRTLKLALALAAVLVGTAVGASAQTTGSISGSVLDEKGAAIPGATVTARNTQTNSPRTTQTDSDGRYSFQNMPVGNYEVTVEATNFAKYVQTGIQLLLNQPAVIDVTMKAGGVQEVVTVSENAALLNTTNAEVGTRFDDKRLSELPIATNRSVYNVALSAAGVSQINSGQSQFANGINFSANGGRVRSNNFMIDGQDNNDFGVAGAAIPLNNPDAIQEVRLVTNQFSAEYGRNSSAVFNAITKAGTNDFHGSAFWFHNDNALNACSNTNKSGGFCNKNATDPSRRGAPFRIENQLGATLGGPLHLPRFGEGGPAYINGKDRTFFFFSVQRWWDRQLGVGTTLKGAPTDAGRAVLAAAAGDLPQVQALLRFLPAAQTATGQSASFTRNGQTFTVPLGALTGSQPSAFNDWQIIPRVDHRLTKNNNLNFRYIYQDNDTLGGAGSQITPPGFSSAAVGRTQGVNLSLTSVLSSRWVNEARAAFLRNASETNALNPSSQDIPSIEIVELGLSGFNAGNTRTAIGLGVNLPQASVRNTYQWQDNMSFTTGNHGIKFGGDIRRNQLHQLFKPTTRGLLEYATLNRFVNDVATRASINKDLPGVARVLHLDWHDFFFYAQDEWKLRPNFTLTYGLRYENPGQPIQDLVEFNDPVLRAAGGDPRFKVGPIPGRDTNNFQPRLGFNWNPRTGEGSPLRFLTGGDKLVLRGGYSRTHDYAFTNIALNIWSSFPFVAAVSLSPQVVSVPGGNGIPNAYTRLQNPPFDPATVNKTIVDENFHMPAYDSFSLEMQREFGRNVVMRLGYVGTRGTGLFESVDANPTIIGCTGASAANGFCRTNPLQGPTRLRTNSGSSIYHSLQTSLEKRLSRGFSGGVHYTWSAFIDTQSEIFNVSSGEIAVAQDSYCRACDRGRSSFDRPHRLTGNFVYELPWFQEQRGFAGHLLGGWQLNSLFTFQSGSPFTPLLGSDPTSALASISGLVGNSIRPNLNTNLDLSNMSVEEIVAAGGRALFRGLSAGQRVGNIGRNVLRSDGVNNFDFGILKNTRVGENQRLQLRADFFNATNTRDFGIPTSTITSANFLNQWGTNGGNRRVIVGMRYVF